MAGLFFVFGLLAISTTRLVTDCDTCVSEYVSCSSLILLPPLSICLLLPI
nr:gp491 [Lactobacillus phage phig1e]